MYTISDSIIQAQVLKVVKNVYITPDCGYFFELINEEARMYRGVSDDGLFNYKYNSDKTTPVRRMQ